jgi:hypothetical protein
MVSAPTLLARLTQVGRCAFDHPAHRQDVHIGAYEFEMDAGALI